MASRGRGNAFYGSTHTNGRGYNCTTGVVYTKEFKLLTGGEEAGAANATFSPRAGAATTST